ncbi:MAG: hypothetical protein M3Y49_03140, partial [Actinomycetota bacterium]|nr:hypothetical protein [Actinomycetota bacterium]
VHRLWCLTFHWSADKELRSALVDDTRRANPWAENLYQQARSRGHDHPHAVRILARAWVNFIWRCWQDGLPYDPARHNALQRVLRDHPANPRTCKPPHVRNSAA